MVDALSSSLTGTKPVTPFNFAASFDTRYNEVFATPKNSRDISRPILEVTTQLEPLGLQQCQELQVYFRASVSPGIPVLSGALHLIKRVFSEFTYDKSATTVDTSAEEVFAKRKGVCQDFAHSTLPPGMSVA